MKSLSLLDREARRARLGLAAASVPRPVIIPISAPQLFATSPELSQLVAERAELPAACDLLEPSAGTGNLLRAARLQACGLNVCAVEINPQLAQLLRQADLADRIECGDFLDHTPEDLGRFDRILMNPPFANAADIRHIRHAASFLRPGGLLVAICAAGPRQHAQLRPLIMAAGGTWEPLPDDAFLAAGTRVRTVLLTWPAAA
ncbi:class I SAM-dependent methyltransferase [Bordetella pseudohinzii]|uniref:Type I restriction-modification system methyltransferase subunit n=1 Tax=Bordetella pseudohinzii TaxID=1331258 RepID=A0A0M7HUI8_9BORD|nr:SAM-dependent methyltransferase [Bordetella pseudohinzii]ANY18483.1 hypothetical protein BBN53_20890 [Bordetella pseudohinzii]KXA77882.1 hypothetical protein AW878_14400 [Bordetella pseudohinzii]KXA78077.1 hypothetical protein AW877_12855 [Bordetella pseudohinzii]CUJ13140.1 Type I restriction-modification system methyltransferase subunit [Bordetella pseudohinzii]